jgi:ribosomal protein L37AE/L43A
MTSTKAKPLKPWEVRRGPIALVEVRTGLMGCLACGDRWYAMAHARRSWNCKSCGANTKTRPYSAAQPGRLLAQEGVRPIP